MRTFDELFANLPNSFNIPINNREYLRGLMDSTYGAFWRHYHNYGHLISMIQMLQEHDTPLKDDPTFLSAILFHDIHYDVVSHENRNEKESAKIAKKYGKTAIGNGPSWVKVEQLIMATTHTTDLRNAEEEFKYIANLDLLSFSLDTDEFLVDNKNVIQEYMSYYPAEAVFQGRKNFLEKLLEKDFIYYPTSFPTNFLDDVARTNIREAIKKLTP